MATVFSIVTIRYALGIRQIVVRFPARKRNVSSSKAPRSAEAHQAVDTAALCQAVKRPGRETDRSRALVPRLIFQTKLLGYVPTVFLNTAHRVHLCVTYGSQNIYPTPHYLIGFYNHNGTCLLRGTDLDVK